MAAVVVRRVLPEQAEVCCFEVSVLVLKMEVDALEFPERVTVVAGVSKVVLVAATEVKHAIVDDMDRYAEEDTMA